jgi:hypothetical protein
MIDDAKKPKLEVVLDEQLDEDEKEFHSLRRDVPGVKGASTIGIVSISVAKIPGKNEFFRTHPEFRPVVSIVDLEIGMEKHFFAVTDEMVHALAGIGITATDHTLYLTVTPRGAVRIVPIRHPDAEGNQNEYHRTKEIGRHAPMGALVHRSGEQGLQSVSCARWSVRRSNLAGIETSQDLPPSLP